MRNGEISMSIEKNIQTAKDFFAAIGRGDKEGLLALAAEDIEWIIPGEDWPLAGTRHGHAGLADLLETASKSIETSTEPGSSWRKETGSSSSASRREKSKLEQDVRGRLDLRHHGPGRQTDQHPGICRHAGTGAGLAGGRVRAAVALAGSSSE
jgi:ketosteroid isomerase-like protein